MLGWLFVPVYIAAGVRVVQYMCLLLMTPIQINIIYYRVRNFTNPSRKYIASTSIWQPYVMIFELVV